MGVISCASSISKHGHARDGVSQERRKHVGEMAGEARFSREMAAEADDDVHFGFSAPTRGYSVKFGDVFNKSPRSTDRRFLVRPYTSRPANYLAILTLHGQLE